MQEATEAPSIDRFIDYFLAALVLRGKREIWVRTDAAFAERRRMDAMHDYLDRAVNEYKETPTDRIEKDYLYFLVRLRNHVAPSPIGSYDRLEGSILHKMATIVSVDLAWCHYYQIDLQAVTATCWLDQAPERMRKLAEAAADAYMKPLEKERMA